MQALNSKTTKTLFVLTSVLLIAACAQPAHKNTMPWNLSVAYTEINMIAPDKYLVDSLYYELASLEYFLKQRQQAGIQLPLLLKSPDELNIFKRRNYFEMASIAKIAEELGFEVYYSSGHLLHFKTSANELMLLSDNQNSPDLSDE